MKSGHPGEFYRIVINIFKSDCSTSMWIRGPDYDNVFIFYRPTKKNIVLVNFLLIIYNIGYFRLWYLGHFKDSIVAFGSCECAKIILKKIQ